MYSPGDGHRHPRFITEGTEAQRDGGTSQDHPSRWQSQDWTLICLAYSASPGTKVRDQLVVVLTISSSALDAIRLTADFWTSLSCAHSGLLREGQHKVLPDLCKEEATEVALLGSRRSEGSV